MWSSFWKQVENDQRVKQLMNTYTERSGATHVCSRQLLREFRLRHFWDMSAMHFLNMCTLCALANIYVDMRLFNVWFLDIKCIFLKKNILLLKNYTLNSFPAIANFGWMSSATLEGVSHIFILRTPLAVGLLLKEVAKSCEDRIGGKSSMRSCVFCPAKIGNCL